MSYSIDDLLFLMQRLRDPETGCPWDCEQTATDIINYSIEEVYELADAIETGSVDATRDELGDVLFQVVFLSQLARENSDYNFSDVVHTLVEKLVRRHPHVFPDGDLYARGPDAPVTSTIESSAVKTQWEQIKQQERAGKGHSALLDDIPDSLPSLNRAAKLQKRASSIGMDWPDAQGPLEKVREETGEVEKLLAGDAFAAPGHREQLRAELGDLLFSVVNLCRKVGVSPEQALRYANRKFTQRVNFSCAQPEYEAIDSHASAAERLEQLDQLWEKAKKQGL